MNYRGFAAVLCAASLIVTAGCDSNKGKADKEKAEALQDSVPEVFHADNDIAMTLLSAVDAIRVGEPLDTADYNFVGVLTDGAGRPLYTDLRGTPGKWDVDVLSPTSIVIRNIDLGDLLSDNLRQYIASNLKLTRDNIVTLSHPDDPEETDMVLYAFDGGFLRVETRTGTAANGIEGSLMRITASKDAPKM